MKQKLTNTFFLIDYFQNQTHWENGFLNYFQCMANRFHQTEVIANVNLQLNVSRLRRNVPKKQKNLKLFLIFCD